MHVLVFISYGQFCSNIFLLSKNIVDFYLSLFKCIISSQQIFACSAGKARSSPVSISHWAALCRSQYRSPNVCIQSSTFIYLYALVVVLYILIIPKGWHYSIIPQGSLMLSLANKFVMIELITWFIVLFPCLQISPIWFPTNISSWWWHKPGWIACKCAFFFSMLWLRFI